MPRKTKQPTADPQPHEQNYCPKCKDGYTQIANELLEALCQIRIPGESTQVFLTILRKTYGFKKVVDQISLSQFVVATGMKKPNICRALKQLETLNVIKIDKLVSQNDNAYRIMYRINKYYKTWETEKRKQSRPQPLSKRIILVGQNDNEALSKTIKNVGQNDTHKSKKENTTKTTIKTKGPLLPICEAWHAFKAMRKGMKKPLTDYAAALIVKKLIAFHAKGHDPTDVLNLAIEKSWQSVYEPKEQNDGRQGTARGATPDGRNAPNPKPADPFDDETTRDFLSV